jgi:hypothetical protein
MNDPKDRGLSVQQKFDDAPFPLISTEYQTAVKSDLIMWYVTLHRDQQSASIMYDIRKRGSNQALQTKQHRLLTKDKQYLGHVPGIFDIEL